MRYKAADKIGEASGCADGGFAVQDGSVDASLEEQRRMKKKR